MMLTVIGQNVICCRNKYARRLPRSARPAAWQVRRAAFGKFGDRESGILARIDALAVDKCFNERQPGGMSCARAAVENWEEWSQTVSQYLTLWRRPRSASTSASPREKV